MADLYIKIGTRYKKVIKENADFSLSTDLTLNDFPVSIWLTDRMVLPEGLWLSHTVPGCKTLKAVGKLSEIPSDPYNFAAIKIKADELANHIGEYKANYGRTRENPLGINWAPSNQEMAEEILNYLAIQSGITFSGEVKPNPIDDRKLELEL